MASQTMFSHQRRDLRNREAMTPSQLNRRSFFAAILSFLAVLFAPKKALSAETWPKLMPQVHCTAYMEDGHLFYKFWPEPQLMDYNLEIERLKYGCVWGTGWITIKDLGA